MPTAAPAHLLTDHELTFLDGYIAAERRRLGQALAREREGQGPRSARAGGLSDALRRLDTLHARVKAHRWRGDAPVDLSREDAAQLQELKSLHATLV